MAFTVTVERDEDDAWVVECPSIPGCVSQGKTKPKMVKYARGQARKAGVNIDGAKEMPQVKTNKGWKVATM